MNWFILLIVCAALFAIVIYALCKTSHDADNMAGYNEEFGSDFDDEEWDF